MANYYTTSSGKRVATADPNTTRLLYQQARDDARIKKLIEENEATKRASLEEQSVLQKTRLDELASLLATEGDRQFNQAIPQLAESAQAQGFLETSGFGNSLAREYATLQGNREYQLARQALSDRDLQIQGLSDIAGMTTDTRTAGTERAFSTEDISNQEKLARELAILGRTETQSYEPSTLDKFSTIATGTGALLQGAAAANGASYFCTHLKKLGLMTSEEVKKVHKKVFPVLKSRPLDWLMYVVLAPLFIKLNKDIDWSSIKPVLCDWVIEADTNEEAFKRYKDTVMSLFSSYSIKGEVIYG